ncbi:MAG: phosphoribosylaminoimidazole carboxylase [Phycisphaeraceae bacterium]|nr:phosphoribosylaminoimidazole carboxylase [Phycisphaeraceae bacterium]
MGNLFSNVPDQAREELAEILIDAPDARIERIVSTGQSSPEGLWYDQAEHEWVVVLRGRAMLRFQDDERVEMGPGDFINIPAHRRHRVEWTSADEPTVWLAVFYRDP